MAELRKEADAAAAGEQSAREGEELALGQLPRLERQLERLKKEMAKKDDSLLALQRRLEVLAGTTTESHMNDTAYWLERGKRTDFATAGFTVGASKKAASKALAAAAIRGGVLAGGGGPQPRLRGAVDPAASVGAPPNKKEKAKEHGGSALPPIHDAKV